MIMGQDAVYGERVGVAGYGTVCVTSDETFR